MTARARGTEGYAGWVDKMFAQSITFGDVQKAFLHLMPTAPSRILDIGAGTGRDAAALAAMGHRVVAVEPTDAFRIRAMALHPSQRIEWLNDSLPELSLVRQRGEAFDAVMLTAVWMHLDEQQRRRGMPVVASLVRDGGVMIMSLRHGPIPRRRRMFDVSGEETIALAKAEGLLPIMSLPTESIQEANRLAGVTWTRLAFRRPG